MDIKYHPIGMVHSPITQRDGAPIQGGLAPEVKAEIEIFEEFEPGLLDVEGFSHLIVLYHFHLSAGYQLQVVPFLDTEKHGVFAVRAPKRPNSIGLSIVRLENREGRILHISEADMLDGTPVLDIKPYVPAFDHRPDARAGWVEKCLARDDHRTTADERFK